MTHPLVTKLENFATLSDADRAALTDATRNTRRVGAKEDIIHDGDKPSDVHLVIEGLACRYKLLEDGRRQITAFFVPGDFCDLHVFILRRMDHSIGTLTPCTMAEISQEAILDLTDRHPAIARALWWATLVDEAVLREWVVNLGQRDAYERVAHFLFEMFTRLKAVGLTTNSTCSLPITQSELADTLGLSDVHVNRTLQALRKDGLIELRGGTLTLLAPDRLAAAGLFSAKYLHLDREGEDRARLAGHD